MAGLAVTGGGGVSAGGRTTGAGAIGAGILVMGSGGAGETGARFGAATGAGTLGRAVDAGAAIAPRSATTSDAVYLMREGLRTSDATAIPKSVMEKDAKIAKLVLPRAESARVCFIACDGD